MSDDMVPACPLAAPASSSEPAPVQEQNALLAALPHEDWCRMREHLEPVELSAGQVLYESGAVLKYGYFPINAVVSLLYVTEAGASAEVAVVGREGVVGIPIFMGGGSTPSQAVVQSAGQGWRVSAAALRREFSRSPAVMGLLLRYTQALIVQMTQVAVCNRHHHVDQQLCRWLLLKLDRLSGNEIVVTQETMALMLGVRREGVTEAALALQRAGLISYRRGHVFVLDRVGLERRCCECYAVIKAEYQRLLPAAGCVPSSQRTTRR